MAPCSPPSSSCRLRPTACRLASRAARRAGISLVEVLISMFVLLVGLLGVAALIPAGRHELLEGAKVDQSTMVGRAAFRDLKVRGYLNPANWSDSGNNAIYQAPNGTYTTYWFDTPQQTYNDTSISPPPRIHPAVCIDPLGLTAPIGSYGSTFPYNAPYGGSNLALTRIYPTSQFYNSLPLADLVFRNDDDLLFTPSVQNKDYPVAQSLIATSATGGNIVTVPADNLGGATPLKRSSEGNYSWLATIVTEPTLSALVGKVTVSVAVFYKRDLSSPSLTERVSTTVTFPGFGLGGGEIQLTHPPAPSGMQIKPLKPRDWLMLAGTVTNAGVSYNYYRWYRVVAADKVQPGARTQYVTLAGPDWNPNTTNTQAWLFDGVIAVYEKNMRLEID